MQTEPVRAGSVIWFVEEEWVAEFYATVIRSVFPRAETRMFPRPELAVEALEKEERPPDLLITAFYFDGRCQNGLWLIEQCRKVRPNLATILMSGFDPDHVQGIVADWREQPNRVIAKPINRIAHLLAPVQDLLGLQPNPNPPSIDRRGLVRPAVASDTTWITFRRKPLVYFAGPHAYLPALKRFVGHETTPKCFRDGYDWEHFEHADAAWAMLESETDKPVALVTDFYFSGQYINGLKLIRQAQKIVPGIWTVLGSDLPPGHLRRIMDGTEIRPDLVLQYADSQRGPSAPEASPPGREAEPETVLVNAAGR